MERGLAAAADGALHEGTGSLPRSCAGANDPLTSSARLARNVGSLQMEQQMNLLQYAASAAVWVVTHEGQLLLASATSLQGSAAVDGCVHLSTRSVLRLCALREPP